MPHAVVRAMIYPIHDDDQVTQFTLNQGTIYLDLERYDDDKQDYVPLSVTFFGVTNLRVDSLSATSITYDPAYRRVLDSEIKGKDVKLLVEWPNRKKHFPLKVYEFSFQNMNVKGP